MTKKQTTTDTSTLLSPVLVVGKLTRFTGYNTLRGATSVEQCSNKVCPYCESKLSRIAKAYWTLPESSVAEMKCSNTKCRAIVALIPPVMRPRGIVRQALVVALN